VKAMIIVEYVHVGTPSRNGNGFFFYWVESEKDCRNSVDLSAYREFVRNGGRKGIAMGKVLVTKQ
jgi:hypothetical protein